MKLHEKSFLVAVAVLVGTCIGAGVLGIPYVASQTGFFTSLVYILLLGSIILVINLYFGEVSLRTFEDHQIPGYAKKYIGKKGMVLLEFAIIFGIYSAIVAYLLGIGESISFLFFNNSSYTTLIGVLIGFVMSYLLWRGLKALKKYEKIGVSIILILIFLIFFVFVKDINPSNLFYFNIGTIFLPFGVILFSLTSFYAIPEVKVILKKNKNLLKKTLILGTLIPIMFYILFVFVVVGFKGSETPEIATLALGPFFILLGIFTMFTSYLSLGNALKDNFKYDERISNKRAWFLSSIIPIFVFVFIRIFSYFSFTRILSIGGTVSGGLTAILILVMAKRAKKIGDRKPEYEIPINWFIIILISLIFIFGVFLEFNIF